MRGGVSQNGRSGLGGKGRSKETKGRGPREESAKAGKKKRFVVPLKAVVGGERRSKIEVGARHETVLGAKTIRLMAARWGINTPSTQ